MGRVVVETVLPAKLVLVFLPKTAQNLFLGTYMFKTYFGAPICPKLSNTYFWAAIRPKHILRHLVVQNCPKPILATYLFKTYFGTPICLKLSKIFLRHILVQNLFLVTYLSKTTQNLFKDFEGYIEKASNLVFCYQMLRWEQGVGLSVQQIYQYFSKVSLKKSNYGNKDF